MKTPLCFTVSAAIVLCTGTTAFAQHYTRPISSPTLLGIAPVTDPQLINPWGFPADPVVHGGSRTMSPDSAPSITALAPSRRLIVTIPPTDPTNPKTPTGTPTGTIFNGSATDFLLAPKAPATFLFSTIDGTIVGWNAGVALAPGANPPSTHAVTVAKTKDGSSYTGLTSAFIRGKRYLYAANFTKGSVDVYDNTFHR